MQNFSINILPLGVRQALETGLGNLKIATKSDKVSIVSNDVGSPVIAPEGSPLQGQIARPQGAPAEPYVTLLIDTSTFQESVTDITCKIGDGSGVHRNGCLSCAGGSSNVVEPVIGSANCNLYETFINKLCSRPYTFAAVKAEVTKSQVNSTANSTMYLPENIKFSRKNMLGDGPSGTIQIAMFEADENFPNPNKKYASVPLNNEAALMDSDTEWTLTGLQGGRLYKIHLFTGVQG